MKPSLVVVDVEADGPCPGLYSMVSFGAVVVCPQTFEFYAETAPLSDAAWVPQALAVSGISRREHLAFPHPAKAMADFAEWLSGFAPKPVFISDNPAFDFAWINYYFHKFHGSNPFGFSARRIGDLYCGLVKDMSKNSEWKRRYRKTKHSHHPIDDARGNAEALLALAEQIKGIV